jgi:soluble lytic murein transglycosylase-like protein
MQLTFDTGKKFNRKIQKKDDLYHAENNIIAGIRYIKYLIRKYPLSTLEDITQLYNLGETKFLQGTRNPSYAKKFQAIYWDIKEKQLNNLSLTAMGSVILCGSPNHSQPHSDGEKFNLNER